MGELPRGSSVTMLGRPERMFIDMRTQCALELKPECIETIEYVRQDIADERVRVAWDAAIRMAIQIVMERGEVLHRGNLIIALEAARNAAEGE